MNMRERITAILRASQEPVHRKLLHELLLHSPDDAEAFKDELLRLIDEGSVLIERRTDGSYLVLSSPVDPNA